ncbi:MAG TPA: protein translocase subunit SecF [Methanothermococcus okinawensis]|uniref:Protein-export membrane protein SecF n=1 Tax=Methanofervidicoccus abyssi TaxID=2082189 RepID=A0A401HQC3_9EURY|nr:protein translocase subunit SecF [Methanofervidicoccus abyssi]GBF36413.1 preprotein translocase subunit SecF [Methanofervidicoccus abyssi]HIP34663.1 protein translocase subunit SecF [Methanothermococcus okinawensis]
MKLDYKVLALVPVILTLISVIIVYTHGLKESIDVSGGVEITITVPKDVNVEKLKEYLPPDVEVKKSFSPSGTFIIIRAGSNVDTDKIINGLKKFFQVSNLEELKYSQKEISPTLSKRFWSDGLKAITFAFLFMAVVVYLVFRSLIPSLAVVLAAVSDIVMALGLMSIFSVPISTATIAALLMLIGYSVDTDILLTTRVLKRKVGNIEERIREAMKTGITMSLTTIVAMLVLYVVVTYIVPAAILLRNIALVILFGLTADLLTTWLTNVGILKYYLLEYRKRK